MIEFELKEIHPQFDNYVGTVRVYWQGGTTSDVEVTLTDKQIQAE